MTKRAVTEADSDAERRQRELIFRSSATLQAAGCAQEPQQSLQRPGLKVHKCRQWRIGCTRARHPPSLAGHQPSRLASRSWIGRSLRSFTSTESSRSYSLVCDDIRRDGSCVNFGHDANTPKLRSIETQTQNRCQPPDALLSRSHSRCD